MFSRGKHSDEHDEAVEANDLRKSDLARQVTLHAAASAFLFTVTLLAVNHVRADAKFRIEHQDVIVTMGGLSNLLFNVMWIPQIRLNCKKRTAAAALSATYLTLTMVAMAGNVVSAFCLRWPWVSKAGPIGGGIFATVVLLQKYAPNVFARFNDFEEDDEEESGQEEA